MGLTSRLFGICKYLEAEAGDDCIERIIGEGQRRTVHGNELNVLETPSLRHPGGDAHHVLGEIDPGHVTVRTYLARDGHGRFARTRADVENFLPAFRL